MEVLVTTNNAKLLQDVFIHLHPCKRSAFQQGLPYSCVSEKYGKMGEVKLIRSYNTTLGQISETLELIVDGTPGHANLLRSKKHMGMDTIQVCFFRFERRSNINHIKLVEGIEKQLKISRVYQTTLINS